MSCSYVSIFLWGNCEHVNVCECTSLLKCLTCMASASMFVCEWTCEHVAVVSMLVYMCKWIWLWASEYVQLCLLCVSLWVCTCIWINAWAFMCQVVNVSMCAWVYPYPCVWINFEHVCVNVWFCFMNERMCDSVHVCGHTCVTVYVGTCSWVFCV